MESPGGGWSLLEINNLSNLPIPDPEAEIGETETAVGQTEQQKLNVFSIPEKTTGFSIVGAAELLTLLNQNSSAMNATNDFKNSENDESSFNSLESNFLGFEFISLSLFNSISNTANHLKPDIQALRNYCDTNGITYSCEFNNVNELWTASIEFPSKKKQFKSEKLFATCEEAENSAAKVALASFFISEEKNDKIDSLMYEERMFPSDSTPTTLASTNKVYDRSRSPESNYDTFESPEPRVPYSRDLHWFYSSKENKSFPANHPFTALQRSNGYTGSVKFYRTPTVYRSGLVNTMEEAKERAGEEALQALGIAQWEEEEKFVRKKTNEHPMSILNMYCQSKQLPLSQHYDQHHGIIRCIVKVGDRVFYSDSDTNFKNEAEAKYSAAINSLHALHISSHSTEYKTSSRNTTPIASPKFHKRPVGSAALLDKSPNGNLFADHPILLLNSWCKSCSLFYNVEYERFETNTSVRRGSNSGDDHFVYTATVIVSSQEFSTAPDRYYSEHYAKTAAAHLALMSLNTKYVPSSQVIDALLAARAESIFETNVAVDEMKLFHNFCESEELDFAFEERGRVPDGGICTALHIRSSYDENLTAVFYAQGLFNTVKESRIAAAIEAREIMEQVLSKSAEKIRRQGSGEKLNNLENLTLDILKCDDKSSARWWKKCSDAMPGSSGDPTRLHWNVITQTYSGGEAGSKNGQSHQIVKTNQGGNPWSIKERHSRSKESRRRSTPRRSISPVKQQSDTWSIRARSRSRTPLRRKRSRSPEWRDRNNSRNIRTKGEIGGSKGEMDLEDPGRKNRRLQDENNNTSNHNDTDVFRGHIFDRRDESSSENSTLHVQTPQIMPSPINSNNTQCPSELIYASIPQPLITTAWFLPPPDPHLYPLHYAAMTGDYDRIKSLVNDKIIKTTDPHGRMPLHCLCQSINPLARNADWVDSAVVLLSGWKQDNEEAQLRSAEIFESLDTQLMSPLASALLVDALVARRKNNGGPPRFARALGGDVRLWISASIVTQVLETLGADLMAVAHGSRRNCLHGVAVTLAAYVERVVDGSVSARDGFEAVIEGLQDVEYIFLVFVVRGGLKSGEIDRTKQRFEDIIAKIGEVKGKGSKFIADEVQKTLGRVREVKRSIEQLNK
ncbi:hypothetical protein HK096_011008 [Nowakowskiella sp. JEL0078]|nr:hypothetical protein HK096_011008 [Nowakowskiella sp. JEL0078]